MARNNTEFAMLANLLGLKNGKPQPGRSDFSMEEIGQMIMPMVGRGMSVAMPGVNDMGDIEAGGSALIDLLFPQEEASAAASTVTPSQTAAPAAQQATPQRQYAAPAQAKPANFRRELLNAGFTGGRLRKLGMSDQAAYQAYKAGKLKP